MRQPKWATLRRLRCILLDFDTVGFGAIMSECDNLLPQSLVKVQQPRFLAITPKNITRRPIKIRGWFLR